MSPGDKTNFFNTLDRFGPRWLRDNVSIFLLLSQGSKTTYEQVFPDKVNKTTEGFQIITRVKANWCGVLHEVLFLLLIGDQEHILDNQVADQRLIPGHSYRFEVIKNRP